MQRLEVSGALDPYICVVRRQKELTIIYNTTTTAALQIFVASGIVTEVKTLHYWISRTELLEELINSSLQLTICTQIGVCNENWAGSDAVALISTNSQDRGVLNSFCPMALQPLVGQGLLIIESSLSHSRHTTLGKTPPEEWQTRRRDLYITTQNNQKRQKSRAAGWIRTRNPSKRANANPCLLYS